MNYRLIFWFAALSRRWFQIYDRDNSGFVDFRELATLLSCLVRGTTEERLEIVFSFYDVNGDGLISKEELKEVISSIFYGAKAAGNRHLDGVATVDDYIEQVWLRVFLKSVCDIALSTVWPAECNPDWSYLLLNCLLLLLQFYHFVGDSKNFLLCSFSTSWTRTRMGMCPRMSSSALPRSQRSSPLLTSCCNKCPASANVLLQTWFPRMIGVVVI
tara:strand:- start:751 stop:1395 length:645 start_codon:yes stop_codon:yes gene_type:complete